MKKLNALALCAVMAPAFALGIGNAVAAEHGDTSTTQQEPSGSATEERPSGMDEGSSRDLGEAGGGGGGMAEKQERSNSVTGEQGAERTGSPDVGEADDGGNGIADVPEKGTPDAARTEQPVASGAVAGAFYADDLIGKDVINRNDDANIGSISDIVFSEDGQIVSVIVGVGGFLGMGDKEVAIPWSDVKRDLAPDGDGYVISVDKDQQSLEDAPAYDRSMGRPLSDN